MLHITWKPDRVLKLCVSPARSNFFWCQSSVVTLEHSGLGSEVTRLFVSLKCWFDILLIDVHHVGEGLFTLIWLILDVYWVHFSNTSWIDLLVSWLSKIGVIKLILACLTELRLQMLRFSCALILSRNVRISSVGRSVNLNRRSVEMF